MTVIRNASFLVGGLLVLFATAAHAQTAADLYNAYDNSGGLENINLNNGRAYPNAYRTKNGNHQFFQTASYSEGSVVYEGQPYYNVSLRYDIYHDLLVFRPKNITDNIGTVLEKAFVASFTLDGRTFVNLDGIARKPTFINGYYEKSVAGKTFSLYAKHHKFRREKHGEGTTYEEFSDDPEFFVERGGAFSKVKSKSDVAALFPEQKDRVNDFFQREKSLQKKDAVAFMTNLFRYIDNYNQ